MAILSITRYRIYHMHIISYVYCTFIQYALVKDYPVIAKCFCQCQIIAVQRYYKCTFRELSDGQEYIYSMSFFTFQQSFGLVIMLPAHVSSPFLYLLLLCLASILQIILLSVDSWFMLDSWINCGNPTIQSTSTRTIR